MVCLSRVGVCTRARVSLFGFVTVCLREPAGVNLNPGLHDFAVEDAGAELWCHLSSSALFSIYEHLMRSSARTCRRSVGCWFKLWIRLKVVGNPAPQPSEDLCERAQIDSAGHSSFPVFSLSLWMNHVSRAFHQLSSDFYLFIILTTQTAQWALPPPGLKTFI